MKIPVNTLKAYAYLLPENEPRPYLNGLHFSKRRNQIECSNGRFLAWEKFDCSELEDDIIVPTQAIKDILKITREEEKHIELTTAKIGRLDYRPTDTRNGRRIILQLRPALSRIIRPCRRIAQQRNTRQA